jgi:pyrimidine-nucleoside phosphorylase/thymidine phosphorylase
MRTVDLIQRKRDGEELAPEEIEFLVEGYTNGDIPDYQMSSFLMAVFFSGMSDREVSRLTECMLRSGDTVDLSSIPGVKVDKHSTGGVGDKTSLIVAPLAAAAGVVVPMISGRALGHTGGTLDKLESIPGFRTSLTAEEFGKQLSELGLCFIGQTDRLVPADRKLYALRDVTATVESIPLISSSIMSKKLAEGVDALVLDVKVGSGAFMKKQVDARRLAQMMVGIGRRMDKRVQALITDMSQPLGYAVGNALEVMEASQTLQNAGPTDLTKLSIELAARMIYLGKKAGTLEEARRLAEEKLVDGSGYKKLKQVVAAQGGNPQALAARRLRQLHRRRGHRRRLQPDRRRARQERGRYRPCRGHHPRSQGRRKGGRRLGAVPPLLHQGRPRGRSRRHGGGCVPHLRAEAR